MKNILLLLVMLTCLSDAFAQIVEKDVSSVYVGGYIRRNRSTAVQKLRTSGFTSAILFNVHVDTDGTLISDGETICKDGEYVFDQQEPYYADDIKKLKTAPTSISRIEICIGGWGNDSWNNIKALVEADGTGEETILYKNFKALKEAIPEIDAVNNDDEQCYDNTTALAFHKMMFEIGYTSTLAPYTNSSFWQQLASGLKRVKAIDRILLQCYDGGAGNNPDDWHFSNIPLYCGRIYYQDTWEVSYHIDKFQSWYDNNDVPGGFVWIFNDDSWDMVAWATGMNRVFKARTVSDDLVGAKVYSENNYEGYCISLPEGTYKALDLALWGIGKNEISSLELNEGYTITVYTNSNCGGKGCTFTESTTEIGKSYNDHVCSIKVTNLNTGVENLNYEVVKENDAVYDLQGCRIDSPQRKGIYIKNNKKVIIK